MGIFITCITLWNTLGSAENVVTGCVKCCYVFLNLRDTSFVRKELLCIPSCPLIMYIYDGDLQYMHCLMEYFRIRRKCSKRMRQMRSCFAKFAGHIICTTTLNSTATSGYNHILCLLHVDISLTFCGPYMKTRHYHLSYIIIRAFNMTQLRVALNFSRNPRVVTCRA